MLERRELLAAGAALATLAAAGGARAQKYVGLDELGLAALDGRAIRGILAKTERLAVLGYRLGVVTRSGIRASTGQGDVTLETSVDLRGVGLEQIRAIADAAFADLSAKLTATGRQVVPLDQIRTTGGYAKLKTSAIPFIKKPFADARVVAMAPPNGQDLVFTHFDSPLTDKSPVDLGNWRAINQISAELGAVVLTPVVVIDFAELSGSGHKVYGNSAQLSVKPGLYVVDLFSGLGAFHAKIALAGDLGRALLQRRAPIGEAGQFVQTSSHNNRAEVEWWNMMAANAPNNIGRPTLAYDISRYAYEVDPAQFHVAVLDGCRAMNNAYAEAAATFRPKA